MVAGRKVKREAVRSSSKGRPSARTRRGAAAAKAAKAPKAPKAAKASVAAKTPKRKKAAPKALQKSKSQPRAARQGVAASRSPSRAAKPRAPQITFELAVDPAVRAQAPWRVRLRSLVARMLRAAALREGAPALEASLRLTDDETIHQLNRDFRHKDKPTDVLAFAQREGPWAGAGAELLGDIVISLPTARRQAKRKGDEGLYHEVSFLAAHGLCHLLGYDHRTAREEKVMNERMAALLAEAARAGAVRPA